MIMSKSKVMSDSSVIKGITKLQNKENLNKQEITEMIDLLRAYETLCIQRQDYNGADSVKNKIEQLKSQQLLYRKQSIAVKEKEHIEVICKQGDEQIKQFQEVWDGEIQNLIANLKRIQEQLVQDQKNEMAVFVQNLTKSDYHRVRYSSFILQKRKYLSSLIKTRNYKQAELVKNQLKEMEEQEDAKWMQKTEQKKLLRIQKLEKKQICELHALRVKLQAAFNERIKQRDRKFEILLKKNRKRRIDSSKPSRERLKSKGGILNESKMNINVSYL